MWLPNLQQDSIALVQHTLNNPMVGVYVCPVYPHTRNIEYANFLTTDYVL